MIFGSISVLVLLTVFILAAMEEENYSPEFNRSRAEGIMMGFDPRFGNFYAQVGAKDPNSICFDPTWKG